MKKKPDPADPVIDPNATAPDQQHARRKSGRDIPDFGPVPVRYRHDGWVPDRQLAFIEALADCGCVETAARAVGMSRNSAYALRRRDDAQGFRLAWDAAAEISVTCLVDSAMARAIHGVTIPIFYHGEQIGERRHFNERLTMFLLRYRAPQRYGKWLDAMEVQQPFEGPTEMLAYRVGRMLRAAWRAFDAAMRGEEAPLPEDEIVPDADRRKAGKKSRS